MRDMRACWLSIHIGLWTPIGLMTIGKLVGFARLIFWQSELTDASNHRLNTAGINHSNMIGESFKGISDLLEAVWKEESRSCPQDAS